MGGLISCLVIASCVVVWCFGVCSLRLLLALVRFVCLVLNVFGLVVAPYYVCLGYLVFVGCLWILFVGSL